MLTFYKVMTFLLMLLLKYFEKKNIEFLQDGVIIWNENHSLKLLILT